MAESKQECSRIEIEPAENGGFSVKKYYRSKPSTGNGDVMQSPYIEPKTYAFSTLDEMSEFLHEAFSKNKEGRIVRRQG